GPRGSRGRTSRSVPGWRRTPRGPPRAPIRTPGPGRRPAARPRRPSPTHRSPPRSASTSAELLREGLPRHDDGFDLVRVQHVEHEPVEPCVEVLPDLFDHLLGRPGAYVAADHLGRDPAPRRVLPDALLHLGLGLTYVQAAETGLRDLTVVAADVVAVLLQHLQLVLHALDVTEDVRRVRL